MKYFIDSLTGHIKTEIGKLKIAYPTIYKYPTDMLTIIYSNTNPADSKSYIAVYQVGESRLEYNYILYNTAVRVSYKGTNNIPYRDFYYICKGIRDTLTNCNNKSINDIETIGSIFNIIEILNLNGIVAYKQSDSSYYCELLFSCKVDITSIPAETLELV